MITITSHKQKSVQRNKKKPPPRPPPPNFSKYKSKSTYNLAQQKENINLIDWSPPNSPKGERHHHFGGSVSSSFSSSTSSLASSKKSFEYEPTVPTNYWPVQNNLSHHNVGNSVFYQGSTPSSANSTKQANSTTLNVPSIFGPTIIRPQASKKNFKSQIEEITTPSVSLPMPSIPPPSPPKGSGEIETPYGIALYDFPATHPSDLPLQVNDVVILLRRINNEWLYGKILDKEGMFPANFIDIQVPLKEDEFIVTALYEFQPQMAEDLELMPGRKIHVIKKISDDWLYGEADGKFGQFPSNFVDRIPKKL